MSLNLNFNFGRLLGVAENLTPARINAIVRGITASITGSVGTSDLAAGAVTAATTSPDAYFYTDNVVLSGGTTYLASGFPVAPLVLTDGMVLYFKADQTNPGSVNLNVNGLGARTLSKYGGKPLAAGDILANQVIAVQYNTTMLAQPTWQVISLPGNRLFSAEMPVIGSTRNLLIFNNVASPTTKVDVTADEVLLKDANGFPHLASTVNLTANVAATGANGLDTGILTAATWYYVWVIYNPTTDTVAALLSTSATAGGITLPAGYTFRALLGAVHAGISGGSTTDFMTFLQQDRDVWINETAVFTAKAGVTAWAAVAGADLTALQALVPPTAREASGNMGCSANNNGGMAVGGDANGLGASVMNGTAIAATTLSFTLASSWRAPLKTAQTVYYIMANTTAGTYRLTVKGYRL